MIESATIQIGIDQLQVSPLEVGRYVGGSRYRLDDKMQSLAEDMLQKARQLIKAVFAYSIHPVEYNDADNRPQLKTGIQVAIPAEEKDSQIVALAAVVCTLGPDLEDETHRLMKNSELLTAMFLDAAGVAHLELLGHSARASPRKPD